MSSPRTQEATVSCFDQLCFFSAGLSEACVCVLEFPMLYAVWHSNIIHVLCGLNMFNHSTLLLGWACQKPL